MKIGILGGGQLGRMLIQEALKYDALLQSLKIRKISTALVLVSSVFVMMATSPPPY